MKSLLLLALLALPQEAKLSVLKIADTPPAAFPGEALVTLTLWNGGTQPARDATVKLTLGSRLLRVRVADSVDPGAEDTFEISLPQCPEYKAAQAEPIWSREDLNVPAGEITDGETLEIGDCRMTRFTDNSLRIRARVRNGLKTAAARVKVTFRLAKQDAPVEIASMKPGAKRDVELWVADAPEIASYTYSIAHEEADEAKEEPAVAPTVKRTAHKGGAMAAEPPKDKPKPEEKKAGAVTIEVCGLTWIDGYTMMNKKFSGWTSFLRVAIKDADGKPFQPTGKFTAQLSDANNKSLGAVQRFIKKDSFGMDALKIEPKNAAAEIVAFDKKTGQLWIGIVKIDSSLEALAIDAKIELDKVGTWEWKGLSDKYAAKAKPADKK